MMAATAIADARPDRLMEIRATCFRAVKPTRAAPVYAILVGGDGLEPPTLSV